jgi:hypothetical protein
MESVLDGKAKMGTIQLIENTAQVISDTADCAIGYGAADYILHTIKAFRKDFEYHIQKGKCSERFEQAVPCVSKCPAHIDVPGYLTLVGEKRYADAIRLIGRTTRSHVSAAMSVSIRVKRGAVYYDRRRHQYPRYQALRRRQCRRCAAAILSAETVKKSLSSAAGRPASQQIFLQLMGHSVTVFEKRMRWRHAPLWHPQLSASTGKTAIRS